MNSTGQNLSVIKRYGVLLLLTIIMLSGYHYLTQRAYVKLLIHTSHSTVLKLYWKNDQHEYFEKFTKRLYIHPAKNAYTIPFTNLDQVKTFRIDPTDGVKVSIRIRDISLYQDGYKPLRLRSPEELSLLRPIRDIDKLKVDKKGLKFTASGPDAIFEFDPVYEKQPVSPLTHLLRLAFLLMVVGLVWRYYGLIVEQYRFVPIAMLIALTLIMAMSTISKENAHPDERVHVAGAEYYEYNTKPPQICDPNTLDTYSPYGASRLNSSELAYFFAGKFMRIASLVPLENHIKARYFNVALFAVLFVLAAINPIFRLLCLPLILSPQIWYLFSYFNSEAFAIFVSMLIAYQVVAPQSAFKKLVRGEYRLGRAIAIFVILALLASMFFFIKKTFYFFSLFIFVCGFFWWWLEGRKHDAKVQYKSVFGIILSGALLFGGWSLYQNSINNFEHNQRIVDCKEQLARYIYKPSTPIGESAWSIHWKEKGLSLDFISQYRWFEKVFRSAFGYYGFFTLPASDQQYNAFRVLSGVLILYLFVFGLFRGSAFERSTLIAAILVTTSLIAAALWKAWVSDFQPQGRYLFAIIPILGVLFAWLHHRLNASVLSLMSLSLFGLSVFSFLAIALLEIARGG